MEHLITRQPGGDYMITRPAQVQLPCRNVDTLYYNITSGARGRSIVSRPIPKSHSACLLRINIYITQPLCIYIYRGAIMLLRLSSYC